MKAFRKITIIVLIGLLLFFGFKIYTELSRYAGGRAIYSEVRKSARTSASGINFKKLHRQNPDFVGWLKIKDTPIDYPVVQGRDNDKYLHYAFNGQASAFGTLFVDAEVTEPFNGLVTIIYGHHMKDGSMFAALDKYRDKSYFDGHRRATVITDTGKCDVDIIAYLNVKANSKIYRCDPIDEVEKMNYINLVKKKSTYYTGQEITIYDRLIVMSTCAYNFKDARSVIIGIMR